MGNNWKQWEIIGNYVIIVTSSVRVTGTKFLIDPLPKDTWLSSPRQNKTFEEQNINDITPSVSGRVLSVTVS